MSNASANALLGRPRRRFVVTRTDARGLHALAPRAANGHGAWIQLGSLDVKVFPSECVLTSPKRARLAAAKWFDAEVTEIH